MKRSILIASGFIFSLFVLSSCLNVEERTQETETRELSEFLNNLITHGHDVDTTDLGVYYVRIDPGEGPYPKQGDTLTIGYAGYFIDGSMFESTELNSETGDYTFIYKVDPLIPGLEDGLSLMNKGAKMEIIIPSEFAYGARGTMYIPQYATLVYVTRMINIKTVQ
jgi:FKBP-type peptidyl-prolyl cis-trans isomerase FkpA